MARAKSNAVNAEAEYQLTEPKVEPLTIEEPGAEAAALEEAATAITTVSGKYGPIPAGHVPLLPLDAVPPVPVPLPLPVVVTSESFCLDIDGLYPQMAASGTLKLGLARRVHWVARLQRVGTRRYSGTIFYREGDTAYFPFTTVSIELAEPSLGTEPRLTATFSAGTLARTRTFRRTSRYYHPVNFEYDRVASVTPSLWINTAAHPNHPADLPAERLSIKKVYERAGFRVTTSRGGSVVPLEGAGADAVWSDTEMHDAMEVNWSRFRDAAQWAMWVFFASLHEEGESLGGIMFDSIGPNHRQGTAIFCDSFIAVTPAGDPAPEAWKKRMQFWTACHEMGHAFNLAHSWQMALGTSWIPLANEPNARSFMNYPYRVAGGQSAFFSDFRFRFSDSELLFMRHAPEQFVEMGNADWFDHHAFQNAEVTEEPTFRLELRQHRPTNDLEFMEPLMVELKLTNVSDQPQVVGEHVLDGMGNLVMVVKRDGRPARQYTPFANYCYKTSRRALEPGASMYHLVFAGADRVGWLADEPGRYSVQAAVRISGEDVVSNALRFRITPPPSHEAERFGQDFLVPDVGRVLQFDGSNVMTDAMGTLEELTTHKGLADSRAATHARIALGFIKTGDQKVLSTRQGAPPRVILTKAKPEEAKKHLDMAIKKDAKVSAETLGNIDYNFYSRRYAKWLAHHADRKAAEAVVDTAANTLKSRNVIETAVQEVRSCLKEKDKEKGK